MDKSLTVWKNLSLDELLEKSPFDVLGGEELALERLKGAFKSINQPQRFDEAYAKKTGNRKFVNFTKTLTELSGQIGNKFYKLEHNAFIVGMLVLEGFVDASIYNVYFSRLQSKVTCMAMNHFDPEFDLKDGKQHMVVLQGGEPVIMTKHEVEQLNVQVGFWETGRSKTAKLPTRKEKKLLTNC
ncbi:hypothetical protein Aci022_123 [Acinetobacter phage vB_AbaM_B09_Aci02-2]|uniref:Uncharacterized protein n=1 Tax=Acinetobacter phage vB_AbaM_B09_Aci02-2 TaxID=2315467 RepID=A0A386KJB7_9CAUD|nr:hypothetical protein HOU30_gp067 [Acinetobacter phage vB_AbaM_B09_Aci02-2]AYD85735.1 hypothetical protein Aci022_123 [Acinetobacter phage vB_AbaM_B09_Aci02-2]